MLKYAQILSIALGMFVGIPLAHAQEHYPNKPIRIIVPFTPGGAADIIARVVGEQMTRRLGQTVIVENKPGASGAIAAETVVRSVPDGYTLFVADLGQLAINPALNPALRYRPLTDLIPLASVASVPLFISVSQKLPIRSLPDLLSYAKSHAGMTYATVGLGTPHHLAMEMFAARANVALMHIPYKGSPQSTAAVVAGDVDLAISAYSPIAPHVKTGTVRLVATVTRDRSAVAPDVPAVSEALPGYEMGDVIGILAPAKTPTDIVDTLSSTITEIVRSPETAQRLTGLGLDPLVMNQQEYRKRIEAATSTYEKLIKDLKISAN